MMGSAQALDLARRLFMEQRLGQGWSPETMRAPVQTMGLSRELEDQLNELTPEELVSVKKQALLQAIRQAFIPDADSAPASADPLDGAQAFIPDADSAPASADLLDEAQAISPPRRAEKLLLLILPARQIDPVLGDLEERFRPIAEKYGVPFARRWFWWQAIGSVLRLLPLRMMKWASAGTLVEIARRLLQ
jgi:hypothetical protein